MGDSRFDDAYRRLAVAPNRTELLRTETDESLVEALAASSRARDPYLCNVIATTILNRMQHARVITTAVLVGAAFTIIARTIAVAIIAADPSEASDVTMFVTSMLVLSTGVIVAATLYYLRVALTLPASWRRHLVSRPPRQARGRTRQEP